MLVELRMLVSPALRAAVQRYEHASPRALPRVKISLARLVLGEASPQAVQQLELAEHYLSGSASAQELREARADAWAYVGSLACHCSITDSASSTAVLSCLESDEGAHGLASLLEQTERVLRCGVPEASVANALDHRLPNEDVA